MEHPQRERGFSLIGLLISATIVCILTVMALQTYGPVLQSANTGGGTNALGMNISRMRMRELHQAEMTYHSIHRSYATWAELVRDGQIPMGYASRAVGAGKAFIPGHDIEIEVKDRGFIITATPNPEAGTSENSPILRIDQSGRLEEVQPE